MRNITSPESFFGFKLGEDYKIARWDKIVEYYKLLDQESDRIQVTDLGPSTEGNPFLKGIITSPDNFAHLEEIRQTNQKIADPRGLSQAEIDALVAKGKAVSVQSMSLHATEIGGTQMAPQLAYDLLTGESEEILNILQNVVLVMVPCFNPDGQIMVTDWYNSTLGTPYEGCNYPSLYHKYTGHDNNRDAFAHNIIESQYVGDILFKEWTPQSYFDHHHMGSYGARIFVPPYKNPVRPYTDPLVYNELSLYGANMCYRMEQEDLSGATMMAQFPGWGHYGYHWITNSHNIAGMLSESANAKLATPLYIHPTQLEGNHDKVTPFYGQQVHFTHPWPGGWWRLGDIVKRQYCAAYAVLDTMAKNRQQILFNMTQKALRQTQRGAESEIQAFIIPAEQFDKGVLRGLLKILLDHGLELQRAAEDFKVGNVTYPAGSIIVPLAVTVISVVGYLLLFNWADEAMASSVRDLGGGGQELESTLSAFKAVLMVVFALFTIGYLVLTFLWILFGFKMRAGRNWARVTLSVFASLFALFSVFLLFNGGVGSGDLPTGVHPPTAYAVLTYVQGGLGLVAMVGFLVLAYVRPSNWYFQAAAHLR